MIIFYEIPPLPRENDRGALAGLAAAKSKKMCASRCVVSAWLKPQKAGGN